MYQYNPEMEIMRHKETKRCFGKYFGKEIKWAFPSPFPGTGEKSSTVERNRGHFEDTKHMKNNTKDLRPLNLGTPIILAVSPNEIVAAAFSRGIPPTGGVISGIFLLSRRPLD